MRGSQRHQAHKLSANCRPSVWFCREGLILSVIGATPTPLSLVSRHYRDGKTNDFYYFVVDGGGHAACRLSVPQELKPDHGSESSEP